jgi:hypothetical protein
MFNERMLYKQGHFYGVVPVVNELCVSGAWRVEAFCFSPNMHCDIKLARD